MKKFVFTSNGIPAYTAQVGESASYTEGATYGDYICYEAPAGVSDVDILDKYYWKKGWKVRQPKPSYNYNWDLDLEAWVPDLAKAKTIKNGQINNARLKANRDTFTFMGKLITCDELSRSDIDGMNGIICLTNALPPNWIGGWKTADNSFVSIPDVATWIEFYSSMVAQGQGNFIRSQDLKARLEVASNLEEIEQISW